MNPNCIYEVSTHWGSFRLDEGAYRDYLAGKLWITWKPGERTLPPDADASAPVHASEQALRLRELAGKSDAYSVCFRFFPTGCVDIPYRRKMEEIGIDEMCLSVRASNCLLRAGANTFGKLKRIMECENGLNSIRNLGVKSEKEIKLQFFLACYGRLNEYEKAAWWQETLDRNPDEIPRLSEIA